MKIIHVVGARPNFMKVAPVMSAIGTERNLTQMLVHTGQHYDEAMSRIFFEELEIPQPDINLEVGSASHAVQTATIMMRFEEVVLAERPDMVLVYGDVNSTAAAAMVCAKLGIAVGHVEAGLRSFDRSMPEEINRLITDQISDLLFTPSADGDAHLLREGIDKKKIHLVGNVMIDTLVRLLPMARRRWDDGKLCDIADQDGYLLVTLHRPSNVDSPEMLPRIVATLLAISEKRRVLFPIHPRTRNRIAEMGICCESPHLKLLDPLSYLDFLALQTRATALITDSGGIQEETTYLGIPCLTVRNNTERPITVSLGTNILVGQDMERLQRETDVILNGGAKQGSQPPLWDGKAGLRIAAILSSLAQ